MATRSKANPIMLLPGFASVFCVFLCCQPSFSQNNPIFDNNNNPLVADPSRYKFSLTSNSDCSNELKNIYDFEATIVGYETVSDTGPTDCTIRITSQDQFPNIQLSVTVLSVNIEDCQATLGIYDGQEGNPLATFDCRSTNLRRGVMYPTSGDTVTFQFSRGEKSSYNFDIEIKIVRLRGGTDPNDRWGSGRDFFYDKFSQDTIIAIIGGFYGFLLCICISVILYFYRSYQGKLKRWEIHQLSNMKTDIALETKSQVTEPSRVWAVDHATDSRGPSSYYSRSRGGTYGRKPRTGTSEDGSSVVYDHDDSFQQNLMTNKRVQNRMATENTSYADTEEDDPDHFVEKVIRPRVKAKPKGLRERRPPSFEEAISERSSQHSSDESEETETGSSDESCAKKRLTSSEEESTETSASETETESEDDSRRGAKAKNKKWKQRKDRRRRRQPSTDGEASSYRSGPRHKRPPAAPVPPPPGGPYAAYPPPGQFVPVMAGAPAFQPMHMVPNYPPPQYPNEGHPAPRQPQVQPTDPPVYSYLVRRGYTPVDPNARRNSPASNSSSHRGPTEEPDIPLQSGVEYMHR